MHTDNRNVCTMTMGSSGGWARNQFTALEPGVPFIREMPFLQGTSVVKERLTGDGEYRLRLRSEGVWWCFEDMDELFGGEDEKVPKRWPQQPTPPLILMSNDEVTFQLKD